MYGKRLLTQAAVRPASKPKVPLSAIVAALSLHVSFAPALARKEPGQHVCPCVAQPTLQGPTRVTVARCGNEQGR